MPAPILEYRSPQSSELHRLRPVTGLETVYHALFGALLPIVCFVLSAEQPPTRFGGLHQSGDRQVYAGLLLTARGGWPFYPLLAYSIGSLVIALASMPRAARSRAVRLGIYAGVVLALQYLVIVSIYSGDSGFMLGAIGLAIAGAIVVIGWGLRRLMVRLGRGRVLLGLFLLAALAAVGGAIVLGDQFLPAILILTLAASPALTLASFAGMSLSTWRLVRTQDQPDTKPRHWLILWPAWVGVYVLMWDLTVRSVLPAYSDLPTTSPSCYIATAAAHFAPTVSVTSSTWP